jgi:hypothetical protein
VAIVYSEPYIRPKVNVRDLRRPTLTYDGSTDAIDISGGDIHVLNNSGGVNNVTLASPGVYDEGREIWIINGNTSQNTITVENGVGGAGASEDVLTFGATPAANVRLSARGQKWYIVARYLCTTS